MKAPFARRNTIRVLAYHGTPASARSSFERQLAYLRDRYEAADQASLASLLGGVRRGQPGLILTFDDGLLSNYEVAAPLLEEYGFRGVYFITSILPGLAASEQTAFCDAHDITRSAESGARVGMSWAEAKDLLARGHGIGCHTASHRRFRGPVEPEAARLEIVGAKAELEARLGIEVDSYAWVGGETDTYSSPAARIIREAGFRFAFTTKSRAVTRHSNPLMLHRTVIDADMSFSLFRAKLAGLVDIAKTFDRVKIERRIGGKDADH